MKYKKWIFRLLLVLLLLFFIPYLFILGFSFLVFGSIYPTLQWEVKARTHIGIPLPVNVFKRSGSDAVYLRVFGGPYTPFYRWESLGGARCFAMMFSDDKKEASVLSPPVFAVPYPFLISDHPGIDILSGKIDGEDWWVSCTDGKVVFSNKTYSVSAKRRSLFKFKTAEVHRHTDDNQGK